MLDINNTVHTLIINHFHDFLYTCHPCSIDSIILILGIGLRELGNVRIPCYRQAKHIESLSLEGLDCFLGYLWLSPSLLPVSNSLLLRLPPACIRIRLHGVTQVVTENKILNHFPCTLMTVIISGNTCLIHCDNLSQTTSSDGKSRSTWSFYILFGSDLEIRTVVGCCRIRNIPSVTFVRSHTDPAGICLRNRNCPFCISIDTEHHRRLTQRHRERLYCCTIIGDG